MTRLKVSSFRYLLGDAKAFGIRRLFCAPLATGARVLDYISDSVRHLLETSVAFLFQPWNLDVETAQ